MSIKTTCIGAYPKPDYLKLPDWFNHPAGPDTSDPTALWEKAMADLGPDAESIIAKGVAEAIADQISCGIDHGDVLLIQGVDFFRNPVNRACKLGEDLAHSGEILVAKQAADAVKDDLAYELDPVSFSISGLEIEAYSVKYR